MRISKSKDLTPSTFFLCFRSLRTLAILLLIFLFGSAIRFLPWRNFFTPEGIYFLEGDNYEHLRKITVILHDFPSVPLHDYYLGFPIGTGNISSPLFDLTIAALIKGVFWLPEGKETIEIVSAVLPPFLGMITTLSLFLWCRELFGSGIALTSAFILSLLPAHIFTSIVGRPDNEVLEPLLAAFVFYGYTVSLREAGQRNGIRHVVVPIFTGILASLSLLYWRGAILWWLIIAAHNLWMIVRSGAGRDPRWLGWWVSGTVTFATIAIIISVVCLTGLWGLQTGIRFNIVSWFHVISALIAVAAFASAALVCYLTTGERTSEVKAYLAGVILFLLFLFGFVSATPHYFSGILGGASVLAGSNIWISTIAQYQPLLLDASGKFSFNALGMSTLILFTLPIALIVISSPFYKKERTPQVSFFAFAGWTFFLITLLNRRYENVLALIVAICGALSLSYLYNLFSRKGRWGPTAGAGVASLTLALLIYPTITFYKGLPHTGPFLIKGDLEKALVWMRENTPRTNYFLEPSKKPEYGVMARWEYGGWIEYIAMRPSIATLYGSETHGLADSAEAFLSSDEKEFLGVMDKNQAHYIVISKTIGALPKYARLLGRDTTGYLNERKDSAGNVYWEPGPKCFDLVHIRLYFADGIAYGSPIHFKPVPGMRLVYESPGPADIRGFFQEVKNVKVFERVKGATIEGRATPGEVIQLAGLVRTNQGRTFRIDEAVSVNRSGNFSMKVYYHTIEAHEPMVGVPGAYLIRKGGLAYPLKIREEDIINGGTIRLE